MGDIWFTSDSHFGQASILTFKDDEGMLIRPFASVEEMDEHLIAQWNAVVKPGDKVYHLGDFSPTRSPEIYTRRLNGKKRLVLGNHDDVVAQKLHICFEKIVLWRLFKPEGFLCTHIPMHRDSFGKARLNVHGHIHQRPSPDGPYLNICVERTGGRPLHMDEIKSHVPDEIS